MCNWCTEHGKGKKWYLAVENYVRTYEGLDTNDKKWNSNYRAMQSKLWGPFTGEIDSLKAQLSPRLEKLVDYDWEEGFGKYHAAQVVTDTEAKQQCDAIESTGGWVKFACTCRKYRRGGKYLDLENNHFCLAATPYASIFAEHPERIGKEHKLNTLSKEEAQELLDKHTDMGLVHTTSYIGTPEYMSKLCSCEYPVCLWMQWRLDWGLTGVLKKGHYVAKIDWDNCVGCKECINVCQFKAINYSPTYGKAQLKEDLCFGCAQCMRVCPEDAVKMVLREEIPALKEAW